MHQYRKIMTVAIVAVVVALSACSTSVRVQVRKAPELHLPGVATIKVDPFDVSGDLDLMLFDSSRRGLLGAVAGVAANAGANKVARRRNAEVSKQYRQQLQSAISMDGTYKTTTGKKYDARIEGTVYYTVNDSGEDKQKKNQDGTVTNWYELRRKTDVSVNFAVVKPSGEILGSSNFRVGAEASSKGSNAQTAINNIENWSSLVREALNDTEQPFIRKIAPYYVWESRTFAKGESDSIKEGNGAAKKGDWGSAFNLWNGSLRTGIYEDELAATYNLGIYYEVQGDLQQSLTYFKKAVKLSGGTKYNADVIRIRTRIAEEERMREAEESRTE